MSAALTTRAVAAESVWAIGTPRLLAGLERAATLDLAAHLAVHGALPGVDLERLTGLLDGSGLTGRGGAGFPLATKIRALRGERPTVVVNGSESEPASIKDRTLLRRTPHLVIDGALAVATAVRANHVVIAVHDRRAAAAVQAALHERHDAKRVRVARTGGEFVSGEARTLLRVLDGGPALPPGRRELPTDRGYLVSNVETFAQTAVLVRLGARGFAATGTHAEPGTVLLSVGGAVGRPGLVEIPIGTPLGIVLRAAQADDAQYVIAGGYHGSWLAPDPELPVSRAGFAAAGATLGAGVLFVLDSSTCALGELTNVTRWLAAQSAGQCGPCRFGLPALAWTSPRWQPDTRTHYLSHNGTPMLSSDAAPAHTPTVPRDSFAVAWRRCARNSPPTDTAAADVPSSVNSRLNAIMSAPTAEHSLEIDWTRCDGHGLCAQLLPERISMDEWGFPILHRRSIDRNESKDVRRAVALCPALALRLQAR